MKKKIILALSLVAILSCLFALVISAAEVDGIYYDLKGSGEDAYAIVNAQNRANCKIENVVIPDTIEVGGVTYKVTGITSSAFGSTAAEASNNQFIKTIVIGAYVESIGHHAFRNLSYLTSVTVNNYKASNPIKMSNAEFYNSKALVSFDASNAKIIQFGEYCFQGCSALSDIKYPATLEVIGARCFYDCKSLTNGDFSHTKLREIHSWAFGTNSGNSPQITKYILPKTLKSIGNNCFQSNPFTSFVLPPNLESMSNHVFGYCYFDFISIPAISDFSKIDSTIFHDARPNVVIYGGVNYADLMGKVSALKNYSVLPFEQYDPSQTYTRTIFYGATTCSECNGLLGEESFKYENLVTEMKVSTACTHCGNEDVKERFGSVFNVLGYSKSNINGVCSIVLGFKVNKSALEKYNEMFPEAQLTEFGVLASSVANVKDGVAFDENGALPGVLSAKIGRTHDGGLVVANVFFQIKVSGLEENGTTADGTSYLDAELNMSAYALVGDSIVYFGADGCGTALGSSISYNAITQ